MCFFFFCFFFSSRRRHTRCALVTGVQTCALPISLQNVKNVLRCTNPLFIFEEKEGNNSNLTSRTITLLADSGLDKLKAAFIGPKGKERLIGVVRQTEYAAGKEPPIPVVVSAIEQKYGDFDTQENSPGQTTEYEIGRAHV